jgi:hypothetical protein
VVESVTDAPVAPTRKAQIDAGPEKNLAVQEALKWLACSHLTDFVRLSVAGLAEFVQLLHHAHPLVFSSLANAVQPQRGAHPLRFSNLANFARQQE